MTKFWKQEAARMVSVRKDKKLHLYYKEPAPVGSKMYLPLVKADSMSDTGDTSVEALKRVKSTANSCERERSKKNMRKPWKHQGQWRTGRMWSRQWSRSSTAAHGGPHWSSGQPWRTLQWRKLLTGTAVPRSEALSCWESSLVDTWQTDNSNPPHIICPSKEKFTQSSFSV